MASRNEPGLVSLPEVAKMLATPYRTVWGWHQDGVLPFKVSSRGKVARKAVVAYLEQIEQLQNIPDRQGFDVALKVAENLAAARGED